MRRLIKVVIFAAYLIILLIMMEFILGLFIEPEPEKLCIAVKDDETFFRLDSYLDVNVSTPFHNIKTNSLGLRDREFSEKKPDMYRILAVGDSLTFGYGVTAEESWPKVLERMLSEHFQGKKIEVINAAVPGTGTSYHFLMAKKFSRIYDVDMVIVGFTNGNDFSDNMIKLEENSMYVGGCLISKEKSFMDLVKSTNIYRALRNTSYTFPFLRQVAEDMGVAHISANVEMMYKNNPRKELVENYKNETEKILKEFFDYFKEKEIPLILVSFPSLEELDEKFLQKVIESNYRGKTLDDFDAAAPSRFLKETCEKNNMQCLILYPRLKGKFDINKHTLFPEDMHWNAKGTELITKEIFEYLIENRIIT